MMEIVIAFSISVGLSTTVDSDTQITSITYL